MKRFRLTSTAFPRLTGAPAQRRSRAGRVGGVQHWRTCRSHLSVVAIALLASDRGRDVHALSRVKLLKVKVHHDDPMPSITHRHRRRAARSSGAQRRGLRLRRQWSRSFASSGSPDSAAISRTGRTNCFQLHAGRQRDCCDDCGGPARRTVPCRRRRRRNLTTASARAAAVLARAGSGTAEQSYAEIVGRQGHQGAGTA